MLKIENLNIAYGENEKKEWILKDFELNVSQGEIIAIIGPSGGGKSTLLKYLAGVIPASSGQTTLQTERIDHKKHQIGYMPQGYGLLPWQTVYKNCLLPYKIRKMPFGEKDAAYLEHLMGVLEISSLKKRYPSFLSGGQRQRVALCRTLMSQPQLLLMDEPFAALDAVIKEEAQAAFLKVWQERQCTTLWVTHSIEEALYLGKRIVVMGGKPGSVLVSMENPWFGMKEAANDVSYQEMYHELKQKLKEGWQKDE